MIFRNLIVKVVLLSLILLVSISTYAQSEKIVHILYDSVEVAPKNQIDLYTFI